MVFTVISQDHYCLPPFYLLPLPCFTTYTLHTSLPPSLPSSLPLLLHIFSGATAALDSALSHSFSLQGMPVYHRLRGAVAASEGRFSAALASLESAMALLGGVAAGSSGGYSITSSSSTTTSRGGAPVDYSTGRAQQRGGGSAGHNASSAVDGATLAAAGAERLAVVVALVETLTEMEQYEAAGSLLAHAEKVSKTDSPECHAASTQ